MLIEAQFLFRAIVAPIPLSFLQLTKQVAADSRLAALKQKNPKHKSGRLHEKNQEAVWLSGRSIPIGLDLHQSPTVKVDN